MESTVKGAKSLKPPRKRRFLFAVVTIVLSTIAALLIGEGVFRILEYRENALTVYEGDGGRPLPDNRLGWRLSPGSFRSTTPEFDAVGNINSLSMNDNPFEPESDRTKIRVLALGDSHTYAVGVSMPQTWPKALEARLNSANSERTFRVYNGGVSGYSLHQYLLRLMDQGPIIRPQYVVLGLSYATDLYDLLPPEHGGWIYGANLPRDYFDFDQNGNLSQQHWDPQNSRTRKLLSAQAVREALNYSATFRYLRRSRLALSIGSKVTVAGQSLWPNMDVVLEKDVSPQHAYQWRLFMGLLRLMKQECDRQNARLIVLGIPYLPQVYDDVWNSTFEGNDSYSRTAAVERVRAECQKLGVAYVDALEPMQRESKMSGRWLHYRKDAHPTAEGQRVIADAVYRAGIIQPIDIAMISNVHPRP